MFQNEMQIRRKDVTVGVLLAFFLGGLGVHRMYMGQVGLGVLYAIFVWTLIPSIIALIECFLMPGRVRRHNDAASRDVATMIRAMREG